MKKIGITMKIVEDRHGVLCDTLESDYVKYYSQFDCKLVLISNFLGDKLIDTIKDLDGFIISGGNNPSAKLFGSDEKISDVFEDRDKTEYEIMKFATENKLPVLGNCHGAQLINIFFGGKYEKVSADTHVAKSHKIEFKDGKEIVVNSYHNYGFDEDGLGNDLEILAKCEDGVVEMFKHKSLPITGILWHPERSKLEQDDDFNKELVEDFLNK